MKRPQALQPGDLIRVVASSSPFDKTAFAAGIATLRGMGFRIKYRSDIFAKKPYLAGSDPRRAKELIEAMSDPEAKAILFARGGYGAMRILNALNQHRPVKPKIVMGYSDLTCVLSYLEHQWGWTSCYGPVVAKDIGPHTDKPTLQSFYRALTSLEPLPTIRSKKLITITRGKAVGTLSGGCLSLITALMGTRYEPCFDHRIIFLEDVNEKPYQIDRMLTHLALAQKFKKCRGLIFSIQGPNPKAHYLETIRDVFKGVRIPILFNFPAGHTKTKLSLPFGIKVRLDATEGSLTFLEPHLQ